MKFVCSKALLLCVAGLLVVALHSPAANVGPTGYTNSFDALPAVGDWATSSRSGGVADVYDADVDVQTNIAATVVATAITSSASDPAAASLRAIWSSTGLYVQTRPTGNRYTALMGKFLNASGSNVAELVISYQLTFASTTIAEEPGRGTHVYYSYTGQSNTWVNLPTLNTVASNGVSQFSTNLAVTWLSGSNLYVLFVDDNTSAGADVAVELDNFSIAITAGLAPTVSMALSAPAHNALLLGGNPVTASVFITNGTAPYVVRYFTNGGVGNTTFELAGAVSTPPHALNLGTLAAGTYNLYATVTDENDTGITAGTLTNAFTVADLINFTLTAPAHGASLDYQTSVLGVTTLTGGTAPHAVQFFLDGVSNGVPVITPPYERDFGPLGIGTHTVSAKVTDARGWVSNSAVHTIEVTGPLTLSLTPANGTTLNFGAPLVLNASAIGGTPPYALSIATGGVAVASGSSPLTTNLGLLAPGTYEVQASATDGASASTNSTLNTITILPNPLSVTVAAPTNGQSFFVGQAVTITADPSVLPPLTIARVSFLYDGLLVTTDSNAPFSIVYSNFPVGTRKVYSFAVDSLGRFIGSPTNEITILPLPSTVAVGPAGYTNDFSIQPAGYEFATASVAGNANDTYTADTDVNNNVRSVSTTNRPAATAGTPPAANSFAVWASAGLYLQTRPTGNRYSVLMGKFENRTGTNATEVNVSYLLTLSTPGPAEDASLGLRGYYSLSGTTGSWINIPAFNTTEFAATNFNLSTNLSVNWTNGGTLFVMWMDDNGSGAGTDTADQFDNFSLTVTAGEPLRLGVAVTSPGSNSVFVSTLPITAAASVINGSAPYTVEYFTNSGAGNTVFASAGTNGASPFNLSLGLFAADTYNLYAVVTDGSAFSTNSATNTFIVADPIAATLEAPADNATFPNTIPVNGAVTVAGGRAPYSVQFFLDGLPAGSPVVAAPYEYNFGPLFVGDRLIGAVVSDASGWVSNTTVSTVHITGGLGATLTPTNGATYVFGQSVTLTGVVAGGTAPYTAAIFLNDVALGTPATPPFTTNLGALAEGVYSAYVAASDSSLPVQSTNSTTNVFTVLPNPIVVTLTSPTNGQGGIAGASFGVGATAAVGTPLNITNVDFYYDGALLGSDATAPFTGLIVGPTAGAHTVHAVAADNLGRVGVSITNTITFVADPLANNNFINRFTLATPSSVTANNTGANTEGGEPTFQFGGGQPTIIWGATLWYRWTAPFSGTVTIDTFGSAINTVLGVYTGTAVNALAVVQRNGDASGGTTASLVSFNAVAGTEYQIQLGGNSAFGGGAVPAQGAMLLNLTMPPFVAITNPPAGTAFLVGTSFPVDVIAVPVAGAITNLSLYRGNTLVGTLESAPYSFVVSNAPVGSNSLYAVIRDTLGQVGTSAVVRVLVANVGVTITTPIEDSIVNSTAPLTISAYTALPAGSITNVDFFLDGAFLGRDGTAPFSTVWSNPVGGSHRVAATALDDSGNTWFATAVNFGVNANFVASNSVWKYLDNGSDQGTAWFAPGFDDSIWLAGPAPLGYADSNGRLPLTTNSFGPDANNKYITTYYRQSFTASNLAAYSSFVLNLQRDDGAVVYLNGVEFTRVNMPAGTISNTTFAASNAADDGGSTLSFVVSPGLLLEGNNVVAVEMHQDSLNSSDIWMVMELTGTPIIIKNVSPEVTLTSPATNQFFFVPASIPLSATASDSDGTVTNVEFFASGVKIGETGTGNPYQFTWNNPPVAAHVLTAVATDNQGGRTVSAPVPVVMYDAAGTPVAAITAPANGAVMEGPTNLLITATANAITGVTNVQFLADGVAFADDPTPPYAVFWTSSFLGHTLQAVAFDASGVRGTSPVVNVTITIPPTNVIAPTVAAQLPIAYANVTNLTNITVVFSERVQNVDASDLLVNGIPATSVISSGNLSNYTFRFAQPPYGHLDISFATGHGITDYGFPTVLPFNEFDDEARWSYELLDRTPPQVAVRTPSAGSTVTNLSEVVVSFSEPVSGVNAEDLLLNGVAAFGLLGGGSNYIFQVAQPSSGTINITWVTNHGILDFSDIPNAFNRTGAGNTWSFTLDSRTTFVQSNATWRFVRGLAEASALTNAWRQLGFNDSSWSNSAAPFFYGDPYTNFPAGIVGTELTDMRSNYTTVYLRREFVVPNKNIMTNLVLNAQSDDGFIAYINGTLVARLNAGANSDLPFNGVSTGTSAEGAGGGATYLSYALTNFASYLVNGLNVLSVHALNSNLTNDNDFGFNAQLYSFIPDFGVTPPRVALGEPTQGELFALTSINITFSEDVTNVNAGDLLVNGVPALGLSSPSNSYYSFTFPQPAFGAVAVTWASNHGIVDFDAVPKPFDGNAASARLNYLLLNPSAPHVSLRVPAASLTLTGLVTISVYFNEGVSGVNASDLLLNGLPATSLIADSETDYFFFFPQPAFGTVNVRFATSSGIVDLEAGHAFDWTRPTNQWSYNLINPVPVVNITTPTNGTYVLAPATVTINATATDADGTITLVEFYSNGTKVGEDAASPYSLGLSNLVESGYVLRAVGTDNQGLRGTSAPVVLNVVTQLPIVLLRGPYLQAGTSTGGVVRWRTDQFSDAVVRYGTDLNNLTNVAVETALTNNHIVRITGLQPETKYFYAFGGSVQQLAGGTNVGGSNFWFRTAPVSGSAYPTRFWVLGDPGTANANQRAVRDSYYNFVANGARPADVWMMLGDNAYNNGTDTEYQNAVFDMYPATLRNHFLYPVVGNHDAGRPGDGGGLAANVSLTYPYLDIFSTPQNGEGGGLPTGNPKYYSFDYGNVHFVGVDSMTSGRETNSPMVLWLKDDLASHTQTWTVVYFHHSLYTKGTHDSDSEGDLVILRQLLNPILEANGVDLVLMGHSHVYERSYLLDGHYGLSGTITASMKLDPGNGREDGTGPYTKNGENRGVVYSIVGNSGQALGGPLNHPAHVVSINLLGSLIVDVISNRLDAYFLTSTGTTNDHYTLLKRTPPALAAPSDLVAADHGDNEILLTWNDLPDELGYYIERSLNGTNFARLATNAANVTNYLDTGLAPNTTYHYRVLAFNAGGTSDSSLAASSFTGNKAPQLAPVANVVVDVLQSVGFTALATDADVPVNKLTYSLDAGAPATASVNPSNGLFRWKPARTDAGTTNTITLRVTDDAAVPLSATRVFTVTVREYLELTLGSTVMDVGTRTNVALELITSTLLTNVDLTVSFSASRLNTLSLSNLIPAVADASLDTSSPGQARITLAALPGQTLSGTQLVARLHFNATPGQGSAFVALPMNSVSGARSQPGLAPGVVLNSGRAVVVNGQALLEAASASPALLTVYGKPGTNYVIETTATPATPASWTTWQLLALTNITETVPAIPITNSPLIFYRARQ